jgi:hypothetical protein
MIDRDETGKFIKGHIFTEETKNKMRLRKLQNPVRYWSSKKRPDIGEKIAEKLKGRKLSKKHKEKISKTVRKKELWKFLQTPKSRKAQSEAQKLLSRLGLWHNTTHEKGKCYNTGKTWFKKGCQPWNKGISFMSGEKHPNWKGGRSALPYAFDFKKTRDKIKSRDNLKCRICGTNKNLCVHHIDSNKLNDSENNLITLCNKCHSKATWGELNIPTNA